MFTKCPSCETNFQVTAEQLKAANGDVRCGQCLTVFNALNHLSEVAPHNAKPDSKPGEPPIKDASTSIDKNLEEFFGDLFEDSPDESFDEPITYANPEASTNKPAKPNDGFFYGANEATIEKILGGEEKSLPEQASKQDVNTDNGADSVDDKTGSETESEPENIIEPAEEQIETAEEQIETIEEQIETVEALLNNDPEAEQPEVEQIDSTVIPDAAIPEKKTESAEHSNVPSVILDELEAAKARQLKPPSTQWVVGSIVLMLVFVLQAVYFSRDSLAQNPTYRPLLTSACKVLRCEINIKYDPRLIEIIGRDVRSHPTSKNALIAGTTLINNASYAQPYPLLTLTFSDITGTKLAQRRFIPREYLRSGTDIEAGMPSEIPIQVELHLVDPGKAAVNFEFHAEVDPRT